MNGNICCTPGRGESAEPPVATFARVTRGSLERMRRIPGGDVLMGNERDYGFAADGEGPVHPVTLDPFLLDETCVTNEEFNTFVNATRYRTDAERFGWSFVFAGHLSPLQQAAAARLRVAGSEWWCRVEGAAWRHPEGPDSNIKRRWDHPVVHVSWHDA